MARSNASTEIHILLGTDIGGCLQLILGRVAVLVEDFDLFFQVLGNLCLAEILALIKLHQLAIF